MERSSVNSVSLIQVECTSLQTLHKIRFTLRVIDEDFQTRVLFLPFGVGFPKENDTRDYAESHIQKWRDSFGFRDNHAHQLGIIRYAGNC